MMKGIAAFGAVAALLIGLAALVLMRFFGAPDEIHAIWVSAAVAFGVQLLTFAMLKVASQGNSIAAWGVGVMVRFVTLLLYMIVIVPVFGLTVNAPLFLAVFLFVTMVVEPLLLSV